MNVPVTDASSVKKKRRALRLAAWLSGALFILFGLVGYLWLPGFAKGKLEEAIGKELRRPVSIERVEVSPYALSAKVIGLKAGDVLSVGLLEVNLSSTSLVRGIPIVSAVTVENPTVHLERLAVDRLNVSDIVEAFLAKPESPTPEFSVSNISLSGGRIEWVDRVAGGTQVVDAIAVGIPFLANTPTDDEIYVEPYFGAKINGAPLKLFGKVRPFGDDHDAEMALSLDDLDLTPVGRYVRLPMKLASARLATRLTVRFARPKGKVPALAVEGDLGLSAIEAIAGAQKIAARRIDIKGIKAEPFARKAVIGEVAIAQPSVQLQRSSDGRFEIGRSPAEAAAVPTKGKPAASSQPWSWAVGTFSIEGGSATYADAGLPDAQPLVVSDLTLRTGRIAGAGGDPTPLEIKARLGSKGRLSVDGTARPNGDAELRVDVEALDLVALQGWIADRLNAVLTRGTAGFDGTVKLAAGAAAVAGDVELGDFNVLDRLNAEDLLRWKSLRFNRLELATAPFALAVGDVALRDFYAKVLINAEGRLNLKDIVKSAPPAAGEPPPAPAASPPALRIGSVALVNGKVDFSDRYVKPGYSVRIGSLNGKVGALAAGTLSPVELRGKVDRTAPLEILGRMDPLSSPVGLDIRASAKGIDLPSFSGYSGRYVGYAIDKGKLSMNVSYRIEKGELVAENRIFLDQLTFGQKVESKDALDLPVNLAIALLKNSRGEIDIDLPIRGSLNDPDFSVGGLIVKVIVNLITKAVTAPFALIGSLFGGGEDVSTVAFLPGRAAVEAEAETRLQAIAKAMADRPALTLEITGVADAAADADGLKRVLLTRKLKAQKLAEQTRQGKGGTLRDVTLSVEETPVYLEKVYKASDFPGKPKNLIGFAKSLPPEEMESLLLANIAAGDAELAELAEDRGQRVQAWLTEKGGVPLERVFLKAAKVEAGQGADAKAGGGRVEFSLR